jgi:hypothetical protein
LSSSFGEKFRPRFASLHLVGFRHLRRMNSLPSSAESRACRAPADPAPSPIREPDPPENPDVPVREPEPPEPGESDSCSRHQLRRMRCAPRPVRLKVKRPKRAVLRRNHASIRARRSDLLGYSRQALRRTQNRLAQDDIHVTSLPSSRVQWDNTCLCEKHSFAALSW